MQSNISRPRIAIGGTAPGRSVGFQQYMADLRRGDPSRYRAIATAESLFVDVHTLQLAQEELGLADQMEGWIDSAD